MYVRMYLLVQVLYSIGIGAVMKRWGEDSDWVSKGVMEGICKGVIGAVMKRRGEDSDGVSKGVMEGVRE